MLEKDFQSAGCPTTAADNAGEENVVRANEEPMLYCPVCSTKLLSLKCKLVCQRCGYYMSCADYY